MRTRLTLMAGALVVAGAVACSEQPTAPRVQPEVAAAREATAKKGTITKDRAALLKNLAVTGALSDGGSFVGTLSVTHIAIDEATRQLTVSGILSGTATTAAGSVVAIPATAVSALSELTRESPTSMAMVRPVAMLATCDVLFLDLGPLHLDLLGLTLDLNEVVLDLNAVSGAGNLLGNLLCAVVSLLDGPGLIASILQLLDTINNILDGLSGLGVGGVQYLPPAAATMVTAGIVQT